MYMDNMDIHIRPSININQLLITSILMILSILTNYYPYIYIPTTFDKTILSHVYSMFIPLMWVKQCHKSTINPHFAG